MGTALSSLIGLITTVVANPTVTILSPESKAARGFTTPGIGCTCPKPSPKQHCCISDFHHFMTLCPPPRPPLGSNLLPLSQLLTHIHPNLVEFVASRVCAQAPLDATPRPGALSGTDPKANFWTLLRGLAPITVRGGICRVAGLCASTPRCNTSPRGSVWNRPQSQFLDPVTGPRAHYCTLGQSPLLSPFLCLTLLPCPIPLFLLYT
jgi:hypothetical protein